MAYYGRELIKAVKSFIVLPFCVNDTVHFLFSIDAPAKQARVFVSAMFFHPSVFLSISQPIGRAWLNRVRLLAFQIHTRLDLQDLPGTNTLAYFARTSMTKREKKVL